MAFSRTQTCDLITDDYEGNLDLLVCWMCLLPVRVGHGSTAFVTQHQEFSSDHRSNATRPALDRCGRAGCVIRKAERKVRSVALASEAAEQLLCSRRAFRLPGAYRRERVVGRDPSKSG